jgi:hypothetical protein
LTYNGNSSTPIPFIPIHSTNSQTCPKLFPFSLPLKKSVRATQHRMVPPLCGSAAEPRMHLLRTALTRGVRCSTCVPPPRSASQSGRLLRPSPPPTLLRTHPHPLDGGPCGIDTNGECPLQHTEASKHECGCREQNSCKRMRGPREMDRRRRTNQSDVKECD